MTVFADGVNADRIARDYRTETREVTRDDTVALRMAPEADGPPFSNP